MKEQLGKRELNKARKREEIVEIATRAFLQNGYAATSMSAIADIMGGSKATLWAHFASKEELFAAVVDRQVDRFAESLTETLIGQAFSLPALRRTAVHFLEALLQPNAVQLFRLVIAAGERFPEVNEMFYVRGPSRLRRRMREFMETRMSEDDARRLTQILVAAITGYRSDILLRPDKPSAADRERLIDDLLSSIVWPEAVLSPPSDQS